jgi:hypothetical protein
VAADAELIARALHARAGGLEARADHLEREEEDPPPMRKNQVLRLLAAEFHSLASAISSRLGQESDLT